MAWSFCVFVVAAALCVINTPIACALKLPAYIGSSMVLQQGKPVYLHGTDTPQTTITVDFLQQQYTTQAGSDGQWSIRLPQQASGVGPISIRISGTGPAQVLQDVLFGDVIVCSGQSNMELPVIATVNQSDYANNSTQYANNIRLLQVATSDAYYNVTTPQVCSVV